MSKEPDDGWRDEVFPNDRGGLDEYSEEFPADEDKTFSAVKIRMNPFGKGHIWIDGVELKSTQSVKFDATSNMPTIVTIELFASVDFGANVRTNSLQIEEGAITGQPIRSDAEWVYIERGGKGVAIPIGEFMAHIQTLIDEGSELIYENPAGKVHGLRAEAKS